METNNPGSPGASSIEESKATGEPVAADAKVDNQASFPNGVMTPSTPGVQEVGSGGKPLTNNEAMAGGTIQLNVNEMNKAMQAETTAPKSRLAGLPIIGRFF